MFTKDRVARAMDPPRPSKGAAEATNAQWGFHPSLPENEVLGMKRSCMHSFVLVFATALLLAPVATAQESKTKPSPQKTSSEIAVSQSHSLDLLRQLDGSLVALTSKVSRAVVQIQVTGFWPTHKKSNEDGEGLTVLAEGQAIGSGVILDPQGYIVTNAHVVEHADRIRVVLPMPAGDSAFDTPSEGKAEILVAKLVGVDHETDLALLKVEANNLPTLPLGIDHPARPGELVFAIGSPEGLQNSITMGVVSSVWRQPDPESPMVYVQTDAPINSGNSGGPLVDLDGYIVGLNTFIMTKSGGSEGLGFAIPASTVQFVSEELKRYGHVHRTEIQASAQTITPTLAAGLGLKQDWGVLISDVTPDGPADTAGLRVQDIVLTVDGRSITGLPGLSAALYQHPPDEDVALSVLRGSSRISLEIPALQHYDQEDGLSALATPGNRIARLGIFAADFEYSFPSVVGNVHSSGGVVVVAQTSGPNALKVRLQAGDIIRSLNTTPMDSVEQLRTAVRGLDSGDPVVLQIERGEKLQYVAFEMD
jgi:serine protease Do